MSAKKDIQQLAKKARKQGWTTEISKGTHMKWTSPRGEIVFSAYSPSDSRSIKNLLRELKHRGYTPPR